MFHGPIGIRKFRVLALIFPRFLFLDSFQTTCVQISILNKRCFPNNDYHYARLLCVRQLAPCADSRYLHPVAINTCDGSVNYNNNKLLMHKVTAINCISGSAIWISSYSDRRQQTAILDHDGSVNIYQDYLHRDRIKANFMHNKNVFKSRGRAHKGLCSWSGDRIRFTTLLKKHIRSNKKSNFQ